MTSSDESSVFRKLFAAYPDALIVTDSRGDIVHANPAAVRLLGYSEAEFTGLNVDALVPDAIRPRHAAYRDAYADHPRARPMGTGMELVAKRRDGSEVMIEIALSPLEMEGLPLVVAAIRGIGAYPRVQQALQRARYGEHLALLGRLAVDSRDPQLVLDQLPVIAAEALQIETALVFLQEADHLHFRLASGVGLMDGEALGSLCANLPEVDGPPAHLAQGMSSGIAVPLTDRGKVVGAVVVRSREAHRFGDDERRFLESMSNLLATSLQRAQVEEALNHAQRLESVGQLTGGIAHDFNNLLTIIQGNLQVLEELPALAQDDWGQHLVDAATRATKRGAELTRKLLAFSRRQVLQPSSVDVGLLIQSLADMLRRTVDQRIRIEVQVAATCPPVLADPGQLESALLNIAINARDAMPEGGTLVFRAEACSALPRIGHGLGQGIAQDIGREPDALATAEVGFVAIGISDNGSGMSDEVKERAFEPFFTTKEAGRGTGLGLSTVYGFAKQSRGAIAIDSQPGKGTTLTLYIPQSRAGDTLTGDDSGESCAVPTGLRVLLVEDEAEVRAVVGTFLEALGCQVTGVASGEQALLNLDGRAAEGAVARFDLLLTDIALGAGMRGTELALQAQQRFPALAVLLMSGFSAELLDADRDSPPSWELLRKPYSRDELARAIARVLAGR